MDDDDDYCTCDSPAVECKCRERIDPDVLIDLSENMSNSFPFNEKLTASNSYPFGKTPLEVAEIYKDRGISHYKKNEFEEAIECFTKGLQAKCSDDTLNAQLYNNRAASNFFSENFRSSLMDCEAAIKLKPDYEKAITRGIKCAEKIKAWDKLIDLCNKGINLNIKDQNLEDKINYAKTEQAKQEKSARKQVAKREKQIKINQRLMLEIVRRRIEILPSFDERIERNDPSYIIKDLKPEWEHLKDSHVFLNDDDELVWPVTFTYPEHMEAHSVCEFNEHSRFIDELQILFDPNDMFPWDVEKKYIPENLIIFYSMYSDTKLTYIDSNCTLRDVPNLVKFEVHNGTPTFIVIVKGSKYAEQFYQEEGIEDPLL